MATSDSQCCLVEMWHYPLYNFDKIRALQKSEDQTKELESTDIQNTTTLR